jgi:hypothetical protein
MADNTTQIYGKLRAEIEALEQSFNVLRGYIGGADYDLLQVLGTLQAFKQNLDIISAHILTLYQLKGQKTKITWEPLLVNVDNTLQTMRTRTHPNPRAAIELALNMSEPNARDVMIYLARLKQALK